MRRRYVVGALIGLGAAAALHRFAPRMPDVMYAETDSDAVVRMLEQNAGIDRFVMHAGVAALAGCCKTTPTQLSDLKTHASVPVRMAAVVALRRLQSPEIAAFLDDSDPLVVRESAIMRRYV